jgi:hypothetical protein
MSSKKKNWSMGIVGVIAVVYKIAENMAFMKPIVTRLDKRIGSDTFIELLLTGLVVYLFVDRHEPQPPTSSPVQTVSPTISPIFDASQHHHYAEPPKKEPPPPPTLPRRRALSIVGKKGRIAWLNEVGGVLYEPEANGKFKAVIVEFRNEPGEFSVITWHEVRASIVYYNEHGSEVADVGKAPWLEASGWKIDMPSQVTLKLIVAVLADKWIAFDGNDALPIPVNTKRARIILLDDREFSLSFNLDVDLNDGAVGSLTLLTSSE